MEVIEDHAAKERPPAPHKVLTHQRRRTDVVHLPRTQLSQSVGQVRPAGERDQVVQATTTQLLNLPLTGGQEGQRGGGDQYPGSELVQFSEDGRCGLSRTAAYRPPVERDGAGAGRLYGHNTGEWIVAVEQGLHV